MDAVDKIIDAVLKERGGGLAESGKDLAYWIMDRVRREIDPHTRIMEYGGSDLIEEQVVEALIKKGLY